MRGECGSHKKLVIQSTEGGGQTSVLSTVEVIEVVHISELWQCFGVGSSLSLSGFSESSKKGTMPINDDEELE